LRVVRGWVLTLCAAALAIAAHGMAGGQVPAAVPVLLLTLLIARGATALVDRGRGTPAVFLALALSQVAIHALLVGTAHDHSAGHHPPVGTVPMIAAHALATAVAAMLLTRADAGLSRAAGAVALLIGLLRVIIWRRLAPVAVAPALPGLPRASHLVEVVLRRVRGRRGPPQRF